MRAELAEREAQQKVRLEEMAIYAAQAEFWAQMDILYAAQNSAYATLNQLHTSLWQMDDCETVDKPVKCENEKASLNE
jgi:hypothetical protein